AVYKILASHPEMPPENLAVPTPDDVYSTIADKKLIQFMGRTATKWNGIRQLLERAGIPAEQAIYFGDDNDDIEPIEKCGLGVAVANALPQVKEKADAVTLSNDEDGVAVFLRKIEDGYFCK
ncbi:MAG: HAD hydrolase family protein, partial [Lachnospiraceae bacterium]|nr:HAD hydrolase family protein [Lachnospiraceae bacterium]